MDKLDELADLIQQRRDLDGRIKRLMATLSAEIPAGAKSNRGRPRKDATQPDKEKAGGDA